ncbi:lipopolysaccharide heptosyltransferase family protein [Candidatus Kaiserbacteria bacterium]|nr:lipopolysaccharide heptosyltransferase family protein [Candidatus Kaiserbacteria bacterium]
MRRISLISKTFSPMSNRKVLTFRPGSIGDCLMGKYFLEQVRATYPGVEATIAVPTRVKMVRELLAAYPWIQVVQTKALRLPRRDLVITPYTGGVFPLRTKLFARLLAKKLIGFSDRSLFNHLLYDKLVQLIGRSRAPRLLECDALVAAGIPVSFTQPSFVYVPQPQLLPGLGLQEKGYVVLHLFSGSNARGLSPDSKRSLIEELSKTLPVPVVLTGSPVETASLGTVPHNARVVQTTLQEFAHLIDHSVAVVSLDTGAAHIAAHLQKPLVVLASCVGVQWWSKDMYGEGIPTALFTRLDICAGGHDYSEYAKCLDAIDMNKVASCIASIIEKIDL